MKNERMNILEKDQSEPCWFGKKAVRFTILVATTVTDISLMYSLLTDYMTQMAIVVGFITVVMGVMLALLPVFIAIEGHKLYYRTTKQCILFVVALIVLVGFVSIMAWVRIATRDQEFTVVTRTVTEFGAVNVGGVAVPQDNPGALPLACMLAFLPLVLGTINFMIGWNFENRITSGIKQSEKTITLLNEKIVQNEALCAAYAADQDYKARMLAEEDEKWGSALGKIDTTREFYKSYVRERIAEHLGDPGATSELADVRNEGADAQVALVKPDTLDDDMQIEIGGEAA